MLPPPAAEVLASLVKMGYDCRWGVISAADAGAPHQRERWFCVAQLAHTEHDGCAAAEISGSDDASIQYNAQGEEGTKQSTGGRSSSSVAYACSQRHSQSPTFKYNDPELQRNPASHFGRGGTESSASVTGGEDHQLAYPSSEGLQGQGERACCPSEEITLTASSSSDRGGGLRQGVNSQSGLGGGNHGIPDWLDRPQWPARPGQEQFDYEPPRVTQKKKNHKERIQALGNAVVPQIPYLIMKELYAILHSDPK